MMEERYWLYADTEGDMSKKLYRYLKRNKISYRTQKLDYGTRFHMEALTGKQSDEIVKITKTLWGYEY